MKLQMITVAMACVLWLWFSNFIGHFSWATKLWSQKLANEINGNLSP